MSLAFAWTDNATDEDGYVVERSMDMAPFTTLATLGPDATTFTDTTTIAQKYYRYRVAAFKTVGGLSAYSNTIDYAFGWTKIYVQGRLGR